MSTRPYRVHVGYTSLLKDRWRYFDTLQEASAYCERVFQATGIVLTIIKEG